MSRPLVAIVGRPNVGKSMTLGLTEKEAEEQIVAGFLK